MTECQVFLPAHEGRRGAHHRKNKTISFTRQPKDKISSNPPLLRPLLNLNASKNQIQNKLTFGCGIVGPWVVLWSRIAGHKIVTSLILTVTTLLLIVVRIAYRCTPFLSGLCFKGTVSRDFRLLVLFMNQFPPSI